MVEVWPGWTGETERSFKEVLFRFLEEVHCTKAALYLEGPDGSFVVAAQYGFSRRERPADVHLPGDGLVRKAVALDGRPLAVNHPTDLPEALPYLEASSSNRMLLVPLSSGGRTVGFVDARDKGGRRPFEPADLRQAGLIAAALAQLVRLHAPPGALVEVDAGTPEGQAAERPWPSLLGDADTLRLDEDGIERLQQALQETVVRDGVYAAAATTVDGDAAATVVFAGAGAGEVDTAALTRHQAAGLSAAAVAAPHPVGWKLRLHRLPAVSEPVRPSVIATAVPQHSGRSALVLSVVGAEESAPAVAVLERLCGVVEAAGERATLMVQRRALARRLLQPGERSYPDLVAHSLAVSRLCWSLAAGLGLDRIAAEEAALAGLLHDVGMRELEYDRLYRHPSPSAEDRLAYRQHVVLGERILRDVGLDEVMVATRHHHERWDGKGYPDRMAGAAIPYLARLVHVAEVFEVLTSTSSYRPPVPPERALAMIRAASGQQFDPDLVSLLAGVVG